MFEINYLSTYSLIKQTLPELKKNKGSVLIISTVGAYEAAKISGQYALTKLMLVGMTRILARLLI
jgi:NAD(P)-dependent dehydrogenase (short-subunit alcohol dehydrogenase family)